MYIVFWLNRIKRKYFQFPSDATYAEWQYHNEVYKKDQPIKYFLLITASKKIQVITNDHRINWIKTIWKRYCC